MKSVFCVSAMLALAITSGCAAGDGRIRALVVTGHNNHNWQYTSRMHADTLEATGRFDVDITDTPASMLGDAEKVAQYQVVILDYNDLGAPRRWGQPAETVFIEAVRNGLGIVSVHAANNSFSGWKEYEQMVGLMWREGTGHGRFHEFEVRTVDASHPVFEGLPAASRTTDELYHKLVNSQNVPYRLLATAMSSTESGGTGKDEPMAFTLDFGKGRVFHTPLGHVWTGDEGSKVSVATPIFRALLTRGAEWAATGSVTLPAEWRDVREHNTLTSEEEAAGWQLLFDGKKPPSFRSWKKDSLPSRWKFDDGTLRLTKGEGQGGDICTLEEYGDFEFACEWKVAPGGNSGVMYRATEDKNYPWETGPEMQILDNARHPDGKKPRTSAGSLYDLKECGVDVARPAGEWNSARVVVRGSRIEHYLNGFKVLEIDTASEEYKKRHAESKWPGMPDFNTRSKGRIALQDHGDEVAFRNLKVRRLDR